MTGFVLAFVLAGAASTGAAPAPFPPGVPDGWYARVETSAGGFLILLLPDQAPQGVAHFAAFAEGKMTWNDPFTGAPTSGRYYDGLTVHKIAPLERFEAGDPTATGRGAPPKYVPPEVDGPVNFSRPYRVGLTRSGLGRINGALFFVTGSPQTFLNHRHPCIGTVVEGQSVIDAIVRQRIDDHGKPLEPIEIRSIRIVAKGTPPPLPEPVDYVPEAPELAPKATEGR